MFSIRVLSVIALALVGAPALARAQLRDSARRPQSSVDILLGRFTQLPTVADTLGLRNSRSTCPMLVARPDTTRLERMPRLTLDSAKMAPMPVVRGCVADIK